MQRFADIDQPEKLTHFTHACRAQGLSVTHQRMAIYSALAETEEHPSAEVIFDRVRQQYPTISLATVYKTLETLDQIGLIRKVNDLHEAARYDANLDDHHHLVCTQCHRVFDYYNEGLDTVPVPDTLLDGTFAVQGVQLQINGVCGDCRNASA